MSGASAARRTVALPLPALVAAARLAAERKEPAATDIALAIERHAYRKAARSAVVRDVLAAPRVYRDAIIPFEVDRLTLAATAIASVSSSTAHELRLYSEGSVVDVGFLSCDGYRAEYLDRAKTRATFVRAATEMPALGVDRSWLAICRGFERHPATIAFPDNGADRLQIVLPKEEVERWRDRGARLLLSVLKPTARGADRRSLGPVALHRMETEASMVVVGLSTEQQIELHAVAVDGGAWLHVGDPFRGVLAPVPSLDLDAAPVHCRVRLGLADGPEHPASTSLVDVAPALAANVVRRHAWIGLPDPVDWLRTLLAEPASPVSRATAQTGKGRRRP